MRLELSCHDKAANYEDVLNSLFSCTQHSVDCISVPHGYMKIVSQFNDHIDISALIDFPYGLSETEIRIHSIILAIRKGCKYIDLVLNSFDVENKNWSSIRKDVKSCLSVCESSRVGFRPIIEYRIFNPKEILELCDFLYSLGVDVIITSTGTIVDDVTDNVIMSKEIELKTGIHSIICSNISSPEQVKMLNNSDVYGIRLTSASILKFFFENGV
jgi:deoxyribose-phosphate aldolase